MGWWDGLMGEAMGSEEMADGKGDPFPVFGQAAAFVGSAGVGVLVEEKEGDGFRAEIEQAGPAGVVSVGGVDGGTGIEQ